MKYAFFNPLIMGIDKMPDDTFEKIKKLAEKLHERVDLNDAGIVVALGGSREGSGGIEICIHNDGRCTPSPTVVCRCRGITLQLLLVLLAYTRWKCTKYIVG